MKRRLLKLIVLPVLAIIVGMAINACSTDTIEEAESQIALRVGNEMVSDNLGKRPDHAAQNALLAQIRRATAKYHRIEAAYADGYFLGSECVSVPGLGAMGHHFVNFALVDGVVNPLQPEVMLYEPTEDGGYALVGVEYIVVAAPWDAVNDGPPMLGSKEFDDHREIIFVENEEGELVPVNAKGGPPFPHYQLHVWLWKDNPMGIYVPFNPDVSCQFEHEFIED